MRCSCEVQGEVDEKEKLMFMDRQCQDSEVVGGECVGLLLLSTGGNSTISVLLILHRPDGTEFKSQPVGISATTRASRVIIHVRQEGNLFQQDSVTVLVQTLT